ncbi:N-alpha-acetyltransferase 30-like [Pectinophora gossypiella]|uniref:N-alpha-acetyltransferase 30-like n=1 Tax=Pectinophora gossypiella TaxID=13191 RepID=UPI00214F58DB|nr:N-alpha-acetyltransferase 30-like [Pectinophora gossypiella]
MNQIADETLQNVKCSKKSANSKNKSKKAKDPAETTDGISILNQDKLSEALANTLHINNIHSNLTNGSNDHTKISLHDSIDHSDAHGEAPSEIANDVNSVQCNEATSKCASTDICSSEVQQGIHNLDNSLGNLENNQIVKEQQDDIEIISYESELQMPEIMRLIQKDLSEPYSIYTYRYFIHNWPKLCFLAIHEGICIGAIVCKLDMHRQVVKRGYIAMLAVDEKYRKRKIGSRLVRKAIQAMINDNADEVVLETEITNKPALKLYENLGFVRDKRLFRYYLNGVDALRLKLWLR